MKLIKLLIPISGIILSSCYSTTEQTISLISNNNSVSFNYESSASTVSNSFSDTIIDSFSSLSESSIDNEDSSIFTKSSSSESSNISNFFSSHSPELSSEIPVIEEKYYQIEYELYGGMNNIENPIQVKENENVVLKSATKKGYSFDGWYLEDHYQNIVVNIENLESDIKLFAKWVSLKEDFITTSSNPNCAGMYVGEEETVIIPDSYTSVKLFGYSQNQKVKKLIINKNIMSIDKSDISRDSCRVLYPNLESIYVENLNEKYVSESGILYSKDFKTLVFFPSNNSNQELHIRNTVEAIDGYAFVETNNLSKLHLGEDNTNLTKLENKNFYNCQSLKELNIYKNLISLKYASFAKCYEISNVNISDDNSQFYSPLYSNCIVDKTSHSIIIAFKEPIITEDILTISVRSFDFTKTKKIIVPSTLNVIPNNAFSSNEFIEEIIIENGITSIGEKAFNGCKTLKKVDIPDSVTSLGKNCFTNSGIRSINIPGSIKQISLSCFSNSNRLREVIIEEGVETISDYAFSNCLSLIKVYLPDSITTVNSCAFAGCRNLSSIRLGLNLTLLDDYAFLNCFKLIEFINNSPLDIYYEFNEKVNDVIYGHYKNHIKEVLDDYNKSKVSIEGDYALYRDSSSISLIFYLGEEESVHIPNEITRLCSGCFERYNSFKENSVKNIIFNNSVLKIEKNTFIACNYLEKVVINGTVEEIPSGFVAGFAKDVEIVIPKSIKNIDPNAFSNTTEMQHVTLSMVGNENDFSSLMEKINEITYSNISYQFIEN